MFAGNLPKLCCEDSIFWLWLKTSALEWLLLPIDNFSLVPIRQSSILIPPVPHLRTFSATVFSAKGFRATQIGSFAGFKAVPQPSQTEVPFVKLHSWPKGNVLPLLPAGFGCLPITSLSTSILFIKSSNSSFKSKSFFVHFPKVFS